MNASEGMNGEMEGGSGMRFSYVKDVHATYTRELRLLHLSQLNESWPPGFSLKGAPGLGICMTSSQSTWVGSAEKHLRDRDCS